MAQVIGIVEKITNRGKAFNVCVGGNWYGAGFQRPAFSEGAEISFSTKENRGFVNIDQDTLEVLQETAPQAQRGPSGGAKGGKGGGQSKEGYWDAKEARDVAYHERQIKTQREIRLQASRNSAISMVDLLLKHEGVKLPAKAGDKAEFVEALVNKYTEDFYRDTLVYHNDDQVDSSIMEMYGQQMTMGQTPVASTDSDPCRRPDGRLDRPDDEIPY